ncbi:unnamed protein product, partial [Brachionus calyciflorus]
ENFNRKEFFGLSELSEENSIGFNYEYATYTLTNTEVRFTTSILGFELYVSQPGYIKIGIITYSECGYEISCSRFFEEYGTVPNVKFSISK